MNKWYVGEIDGHPVEVFLSDNWDMDTWTPYEVPAHVEEACEAIRQADCRSLKGCQRVLSSVGWSNS